MQSTTNKIPNKKPLFFLFVGGAFLFGLSLLSLKTNSALSQLDYRFLLVTTNNRLPILNVLFKTIGYLSGPLFLMLVTLLIALIWLIRTKKPRAPLLLLTSLAGANLLTIIIKALTKKARPDLSLLVPPMESGFSFPSNHTVAITVFCLMLGYLIYLTNPQDKTTFLINWALTTVLCVLLVALSRLYLGYHWISDVTGAIGLSLMVFVITVLANQHLKSKA